MPKSIWAKGGLRLSRETMRGRGRMRIDGREGEVTMHESLERPRRNNESGTRRSSSMKSDTLE